ncbi:hypothetical protein OIU85_009181 [Salix viminalis]|uniref:Uncharacterized protein n=1 Tax=Salix viminalis TaxID=40686 RepID=A0A9Q0NZD1_SALVM|nr:hypothetical protein OIU85_009181 [Salix viminalis]
MQLQEMGPRTSPRGRWFTLFFKIVIVLEMVTFAGANSDGDPMGEPAAGLLCISDCVTCPVICSPPPPPLLYHPSPPSHHSPSPQHSYHSPPPPPPTSPSTSPPPPPPTSPPAYHSPPQSPQAPSWYPIWGTPPPPGYYFNTPKGQAPPGKGPYPYPYYYFYSSKASSFSLHASHFFLLGVFHVVYLLF